MTAKAASDATPQADHKSRGGRPSLDRADVRSTTIGVRLTRSERDAVLARAEAAGVRPAEMIRVAALKMPLPAAPAPSINREEYARLASLSANLNQLTRHANTGATVTVDRILLEQIHSEVARLRLALIGAA